MSEKIIQLNEEVVKGEFGSMSIKYLSAILFGDVNPRQILGILFDCTFNKGLCSVVQRSKVKRKLYAFSESLYAIGKLFHSFCLSFPTPINR